MTSQLRIALLGRRFDEPGGAEHSLFELERLLSKEHHTGLFGTSINGADVDVADYDKVTNIGWTERFSVGP